MRILNIPETTSSELHCRVSIWWFLRTAPLVQVLYCQKPYFHFYWKLYAFCLHPFDAVNIFATLCELVVWTINFLYSKTIWQFVGYKTATAGSCYVIGNVFFNVHAFSHKNGGSNYSRIILAPHFKAT